MDLNEMLEELRCNILRDVSTAVASIEEPGSADAPRLVTDRALVRYINDAQNKFAKATRCLVDTTSDAAVLQLRAGIATYQLSRVVFDVEDATIAGRRLHKTTEGALFGKPSMPIDPTCVGAGGAPRFFWMDRASNTITFYPTPSANDVGLVHLRAVRLPRTPLSLDAKGAEPEVPVDFHMDLLEWAAFRVYRNHDVDVENFGKANGHRARFYDAIEEYKRQGLLRNPPQFSLTRN